MNKKAMIYNFLMFFLVMTVFVVIYVALHDRKAQIIDPKPPLGTFAQEIFNTIDEGELLQLSFQQATIEVLCVSYPLLKDTLQPRLRSQEKITQGNLLADFENILSEKINPVLASLPSYEKAPFIVYSGEQETSVIATKPWIMKKTSVQGTIEIPIRPAATIDTSLHFRELSQAIHDVSEIGRNLVKDITCVGNSDLLKMCVEREVKKIQATYDSNILALKPPSEYLEQKIGEVTLVSFTVPIVVSAPKDCSEQGFQLEIQQRIPLAQVKPETPVASVVA